MKNGLLLLLVCLLGLSSFSQTPNLPVKATLSETLLSGRNFTASSQVDTVTKLHALPGSYTLEFLGKVNSATGRGLDIEARSKELKGYRLSLDAANLKWTAPLTSSTALTASAAGQNQTIRIAVNNDTAHIYQNGAYIQSQPLAAIKDIAGGVETDNVSGGVKGPTLIGNWAGTAPNNTGKPSDYGWLLNPPSSTLFSAANSSTVGTSRYIDVNASSGGNLHTYSGSTYVGRLLYMRWDGSHANTVYSYPVTLEANATYDFSLLFSYVSNGSPGTSLTVGIGTTTAASGRIATKSLLTFGTARQLKKEDFFFTAPASGTYYLTFNGPTAVYSIGELAVNKLDIPSRFVFGKNYPTGAVNMQISAVTYEDGAYAPASIVTGPIQTVTVTAKTASYLPTFNTNFVLPGKTDLHLTGDHSPLVNSTVALNSNDAWLFFDNIKPTEVIANWLDKVTINGVPANANPNVRIAIYRNGTAVIPNGNLTSQAALEAFTQPALGGSSQTYAVQVYNDSLAAFDNAIRSFKLKRGYMATLANNADGSGYSRVFIANDSDLVVNAMPAGLDTTVSFIRVFKWDWISKKGKAGMDPADLNATWYYNWNINGAATSNYAYEAIRQSAVWPPWNAINAKPDVTHLLGFNEPDRPDQANMTVEQCVAGWPQFMNSGLRIGTPCPANPESSFLTSFLAKTDSLNYRVDFVAIHCYWGGQSPTQWYNRLKNIYNKVKRPLWITEWNNGANWTTENWPSDTTAALQKQLSDIKGILQVLDTASFVERYAIYEWVEYKRMMSLADSLTPAGKYYAADKSDFAYNPKVAFTHTWKLIAPALSGTINSDYYTATLDFEDMNGETGGKYILERKIDGVDADFVPVQEFTGYDLYSAMNFTDSVFNKATYRVKVIDRGETEFVYSAPLDMIRDAAPVAPTSFTGFVLSTSKDSVKWNAGAEARAYNLKRSLDAAGPFVTIASNTTQLAFEDSGLQPSTTYYYVVTSLNSAGESDNSTALSLTTNPLVAPASVLNPHAASGDEKAILTWDFQFDAKYDITRSETAGGPFVTIATDVDTTRYEDAGRTNGTTYYYKVVAQNAAGRSPETAELSATPLLGQHLFVRFDENSGTFAEDAWGGYHGAVQPTAAWTPGKTASAIKLNGTSTSYVSLASGPVSTLNDFTVATWIKMDALSTFMRIFDFGSNTTNFMFLTPQTSLSNGKSVIRFGIRVNGVDNNLTYAYTWPLNTWTHLAITKAGNTASMYINGELMATNTSFVNKPSDLGITTKNYIGKSQFSDPVLKGSVDEFKIYNRALSAAELADAMKQEQTITFAPLAQKQMGDADFDAGATASSNLPVSYVSSNVAVATIVNGLVHIVGAGTTTITASQAGDARYSAAVVKARDLTVVKQDQTITFNALSQKFVSDGDFAPGATSSSGLEIVYTSSNANVAIIVNGLVHLVGAGAATITATQAGDATYNPAVSVERDLTVVKQDQTITFGALNEKVVGDADFAPGASASSGLEVVYTSSNPNVATISNGAIHIVGGGTTTITARQTGNDFYNASADVEQPLTVLIPPSVTAKNITVELDENGAATITPAMVNDGSVSYNGTLILSLSRTAFDCSDAGSAVAVMLSGMDEKGLTRTASATVTVVDNRKPTIAAPSTLTVNANGGSCSATGLYLGLPSTDDNCGVQSVTNDAPVAFPVGNTTVTWTVTDVHGNTAAAMQTVTVSDNQKPVLTVPTAQVFCYNGSNYTVPSLTATDNCGIASVTYTISGATNRTGSGGNASGGFNTGLSTIVWTVTDVHNNQTTGSTTVEVNNPLQASIPDVYAMNPSTDAKNTIYIGYGPTSLTIQAVPGGGAGTYQYSWNTGQASPSISVAAAGTYVVTVTDAKSCQTTASILIKTLDVTCGNNNDKVMVCHNNKTICVASSAVQAHLNHGDNLGACGSVTTQKLASPILKDTVAEGSEKANKVLIYPNPVKSSFRIQLTTLSKGATLQLLNAVGATVLLKNLTNSVSTVSMDGLAAGVYYARVRNGSEVTTEKIVKE